jgi:hypothetical protein
MLRATSETFPVRGALIQIKSLSAYTAATCIAVEDGK